MSTLTILLYHGVTDKKEKGILNYSNKHIHVSKFENQMQYIKNNCNILNIDEVIYLSNKKKKWPDKSVLVTFDDGFKNNFTLAYPILNNLKIPAVFYVCAGMIGSKKMFWVDEIEDCINFSKKKKFFLNLNKKIKIQINNKKNKIFYLEKIKKFCKKTTTNKKNLILKNLRKKTKIVPSNKHSKNYEIMNWREIKKIDKNPLFTIGGHTLFHDIMSSRSLSDVNYDIKKTINILKKKLNHKIEHFSYPEGQKIHFNNKIISLLRENKIICSPSAINGVNQKGEDLFKLKRIMPEFMGRKFPKKFR